MRSIIPWYGGKYYQFKELVKYFPQHWTFIDGFGGGGQVIMNKFPSKVEIYNDINSSLYNFYSVLKDESNIDRLKYILTLSPYSNKEFENSNDYKDEPDPVLSAAKFYIRLKQSFNYSFKTWSMNKKPSRRGMAKVVSSYLHDIDEHLPKVIERLRQIQLMNEDFIEMMPKFSNDSYFIYLDPTYIPDARTAKNVYEYEMTIQQHEDLLKAMLNNNSKIMISGYDSELYNDMLSNWRKIEIGNYVKRAALVKQTENKSIGTEYIWINYSDSEIVGNVDYTQL